MAEACLKEGYVKEITQELLQDIGNELRKENGSHYLALKTLEVIDEDCDAGKPYNVIIDSIRNDWEVKFLRQFPKFFLVSVFADTETRFGRWSKQNPKASFEDFETVDRRDAEEIFIYGQKVEKCTYESDIVINNDETIEISNPKARENHVKEKFQKYLDLIEKGPSVYIRPSLDEKLMTLAYLESMSSSCLQRKVGAVISTEDGHIISVGYNNVPFSERTCYDQYGECYRNFLKKAHARLLKSCPICGRKITLECPKCSEKIEGYEPICAKCKTELKFDYVCSGCGKKIFEIFTPGAKQSIGKLLDVCRALHAEENAIVNAAKIGNISLVNATIFSTTYPCKLCANKISQVGIKKVVYNEPYSMAEAREILNNRGVKVIKFEGVKSSAFFRLFGT